MSMKYAVRIPYDRTEDQIKPLSFESQVKYLYSKWDAAQRQYVSAETDVIPSIQYLNNLIWYIQNHNDSGEFDFANRIMNANPQMSSSQLVRQIKKDYREVKKIQNLYSYQNEDICEHEALGKVTPKLASRLLGTVKLKYTLSYRVQLLVRDSTIYRRIDWKCKLLD